MREFEWLQFINHKKEVSEVIFNKKALELYDLQKNRNHIYNQYLKYIGAFDTAVRHFSDIKCLPISFFKTHSVGTLEPNQAKLYFESSGTINQKVRSKHYVWEPLIYEKSILEGFKLFYGNPEDYCFFCFLPNYLENKHSSLVYMFRYLQTMSKNFGGFYQNNISQMIENIEENRKGNKKIFLLGVSFALLDHAHKLKNILTEDNIVMETGGMKGKKKEITREELHSTLKESLGVKNIHSEYGMTEMMSQSYSNSDGIYKCPPWKKVLFRDYQDPFKIKNEGIIQVIDLANIHSCAFVETQDLGKRLSDESFEIIGRVDNSETRGCNLLWS